MEGRKRKQCLFFPAFLFSVSSLICSINVCFLLSNFFQSSSVQKFVSLRVGAIDVSVLSENTDNSMITPQSPQLQMIHKKGNVSKKTVRFKPHDPSETPVQPAKVCRQLSFDTIERPKRTAAPTSLKESSLKNKMRQ